MDLVDMYRHFCQCLGSRLWGRWTWQMRREGRWISSQCDYFLGRETDRRRFQCISVQMPCYHSNYRALVAVIYAEGGGELKRDRRRVQLFPISLPRGPQTQLDAGYEELLQHVVCPPPGSALPTNGSPTQHGRLSTTAQCCIGRACSPKQGRATWGRKSRYV